MTRSGGLRYNLNMKRGPTYGLVKKAAAETREVCRTCSKDLSGSERALFVEEEVGRLFCTEACIAKFFLPEIEKLEKSYFKNLSPRDLSGEEREGFAHLRWVTLEEPDEVWCVKTKSGDIRYTFISEFKPKRKKVWCVCICLILRGEPSFLYLAFPTSSGVMVNQYRKGERVTLEKPQTLASSSAGVIPSRPQLIDGLATEWTEEETLRAQVKQVHRADDIPPEKYALYHNYLEETLENPDEVWSLTQKDENTSKVYHFIRHYADEDPGIWYIIVARETESQEELDVIEAFPTRDSSLADRYRRDEQELGLMTQSPALAHQVH